MKNEFPFPLLRVAGELSAIQDQIAGAGASDVALDGRQPLLYALEDVPVRRPYTGKFRRSFDRENKRKKETSSAQQNRAAAAAAPTNRDKIATASGFVDVVGQLAAGAKHHRRGRPFPESQNFARLSGLRLQEQRFVEGKILRHGGQREVETIHYFFPATRLRNTLHRMGAVSGPTLLLSPYCVFFRP